MYENTFPSKRYKHTIQFLKEVVPNTNITILDLGVRNPFVDFMEREGYTVKNTSGEDLDLDTTAVQNKDYDVITAFEIFEHLLSPFHVLKDVKGTKIVASIPLKLWFSPAYQSKTDPWDRHYHEFEDWQFDWIFEKAGWEIKKRQKFTNPVKKIGIRPLLRLFTPRYYLIYAEKKS
ncbi:methyltransferase [uncultured Dokdonia sp.]|uniref:methyltransferase n=1 Tax=uncultured Dokdonia sp. TaxID=575653 RepID=UPI00260A0054|nr:methyltransferase [uncultured Dokdonia sp.]